MRGDRPNTARAASDPGRGRVLSGLAGRALAGCVLLMGLGAPAAASQTTGAMPEALALCADGTLSIAERAERFVDAGWRENASAEGAIIAALAGGIFLSNVEPGAPETWAEEWESSAKAASRLRTARGFDGLRFLATDDFRETVTLEPNRAGLATCLFTGATADLTAASALVGSAPLMSGPRASLRGDIDGGLLVAFSFDAADAEFAPPLPYRATFTIVLDRRGGS